MILTLALSAFASVLPAASVQAAPTVPAGWHTFVDPVYHFTISYPPTWTLERGYDGSHITLVNLETSTTLTPIISMDSHAPETVLAQAKPTPANQTADHATVTARQLDGHPALDVFYPYIAPTHPLPHDAAVPIIATRWITLPVRNSAGTTNVYAFQSTMTTDKADRISAAVQADEPVVTAMLATFSLPAHLAAVPTLHVGPNPQFGSCNSVCWADANWNYNKYDDSSALYCNYSDGYTGNYGNYACGNNNNLYGVQTPDTQQNNRNYFQPYFQCAEFVARALSQNQEIPGLSNGGANGSTPPTPTIGSYSYGNFPMTYMGRSYSQDTIYALTDTGTDTIWGLYQYMLGTFTGNSTTYWGSGIGTAESPNTLSQAQPGDVVFFYTSGSGGYNDLANLEHVMLITSTNQTESGTLLDGHNVDAYHVPLSQAKGGFTAYQVVHLKHNVGKFGNATLSGSGWNYYVDNYGQSAEWVYTSCGSCDTAGATFTYNNGDQCAIAVYVPQYNATAQVNFGVYNTGGGSVVRGVNENIIDGWALLYMDGDLNSTYDKINVSNNTGTSGQQLGIGYMAFMC